MKYKYQSLKDKIKEKGYILEYIAKELGISPVTLNSKIKGTCPFKLPELYKLVDVLDLKKEEILNIFLKNKSIVNGLKREMNNETNTSKRC